MQDFYMDKYLKEPLQYIVIILLEVLIIPIYLIIHQMNYKISFTF